MPKSSRPATSGYARIAQAEEEELLDDSEEEDPYRGHASISNHDARYAPIQPKRQTPMQTPRLSSGSRRKGGRHRSNSGVDIKAINARLERWAEEIASKFKIKKTKGRTAEDEQLEIHYSVFQAPDWIRPATAETLHSDHDSHDDGKMTKEEFDEIVESVKVAIEMGVHPKLISQGSSGSYFATNSQGKVMAVFKPKDEEPYASRNPKWTKWIHRNLFPFAFGRAMLIPNLSYISEAAAYILDHQLRTNIVPYTDIVSLSSKSFHYDYWDRRAFYRKKKPLPEKQGSFQIFLNGFRDASRFLKENPWPDQHSSSLRDGVHSRNKKRRGWTQNCRPGAGDTSEDEADDMSDTARNTVENAQEPQVFWTEELQLSFREQLEKLVILDYIMRNTDRGPDNWMIRIDQETQKANIVAEAPKISGYGQLEPEQYSRQDQMTAASRSATPSSTAPKAIVHLGAIDNSLAWPWKHPDAWRSYPFGWLFLPVSLIGQPFSEATRKHFLPLLTSKQWWSETQLALRRCFSQDSDFQEKMYAKQIAVMKGQAWNVVETLKTPDHGPLELTRRARVYVWDDLVDVPVVVPLRVPSAEMRRRQSTQQMGEAVEEVDIGTSRNSAPQPHHDLLGMASPSADLPNGQFNMSRQASKGDSPDDDLTNVGALSPSSVQALSWGANVKENSNPGYFSQRSVPSLHRSRMSYDGPRRQHDSPDSKRRRSYSHRVNSATFHLADEDDGDLGYAAAEDREGNRKRVIVERLETVKSKNPVFTWC